MDDNPKIVALSACLINAIDTATEQTPMTTGEVMGALFSVLVAAARESPNYHPAELVAEMDAKIREAVADA